MQAIKQEGEELSGKKETFALPRAASSFHTGTRRTRERQTWRRIGICSREHDQQYADRTLERPGYPQALA